MFRLFFKGRERAVEARAEGTPLPVGSKLHFDGLFRQPVIELIDDDQNTQNLSIPPGSSSKSQHASAFDESAGVLEAAQPLDTPDQDPMEPIRLAARSAFERKDFAHALELTERGLAQSPRDLGLLLEAARKTVQLAMWDEAERYWSAVIDVSPPDLELAVERILAFRGSAHGRADRLRGMHRRFTACTGFFQTIQEHICST